MVALGDADYELASLIERINKLSRWDEVRLALPEEGPLPFEHYVALRKIAVLDLTSGFSDTTKSYLCEIKPSTLKHRREHPYFQAVHDQVSATLEALHKATTMLAASKLFEPHLVERMLDKAIQNDGRDSMDAAKQFLDRESAKKARQGKTGLSGAILIDGRTAGDIVTAIETLTRNILRERVAVTVHDVESVELLGEGSKLPPAAAKAVQHEEK